jgi:adenine-specific DNA-methyltransferase
VGTQAQFRAKKPPKRYRYDSSLSPVLEWDAANSARELGEWVLECIEEASRLDPPHEFPEPRSSQGLQVSGLKDAVQLLKSLSEPFLQWAGKGERLSFDVPTLPLFVHERLSTKAILETLSGHERDQQTEMQLFADPTLPLHQQLEAYQHKGGWVNRLILGDSLVVMNSLLEYEGLGGQAQTIFMDPPYGVRFGSNFQPFVRRRDVKNNDDLAMTREPEMVKAYRDTWELGLHSYLTYMRDRLLLARELLKPSGSVFVQIGDENVHHVREVLDEVFGAENFVGEIAFTKAAGGLEATTRLSSRLDYLLWYARSAEQMKYNPLYEKRVDDVAAGFNMVELPDGTRRSLTKGERTGDEPLPKGARLFMSVLLTKPGPGVKYEIEYEGRVFNSGNRWWGTPKESLERVIDARRVMATKTSLRFVRYLDDFPFRALSNLWDGLGGPANPTYVVQTNTEVVRRCLLMTSDPGDLALDPTCGSGTTAYVAEHWGRRWITIDTSRVPLALTRQRLLTATFPYYALQDRGYGPSGGFVYERKRNRRGEEVGGIVPHVTLKSIANDEPPDEEVLVDRPHIDGQITRVSGPFVVEATIPTPVDFEGDGIEDSGVPQDTSYSDRMLEALRRNPVLHLGNKTMSLENVRPPTQSLVLSAEAVLQPESPAAIVFGPENGAVSEKLVFEAAREAHMRNFGHLLVIGFAIEPTARAMVGKIESQVGIPATYVQATPDLVMGDLLKTMRSSELFSVSGLPEVVIRKVDPEEKGGPQRYEVELCGLDTFDPTTFEVSHRNGDDVPAWLLDTAWNGLCFHVSQAFFPRTSAWDNLKKMLKTDFEESVWEHLSGTVSAPFTAGEVRDVAVKVIDDRGNELLVVKSLDEAE